MVKSLWEGVEVPLTDDGGLVSGRLEQLGEGLLVAIKDAVLVIRKAVLVRVLSSKEAGAGGSGDGIDDKGVIKSHSVLLGKSVDIRRLDLAAIGGDHLGGMVIALDDQDIVPSRGLVLSLGSAGSRQYDACHGTKPRRCPIGAILLHKWL